MATIVTIGAGIAGVVASRELVDAGHDVVVLDKGYTPGGRMATRHLGGATFDHGAQFFTTKDPWFADVVDGWLAQERAAAWFTSSPDRPDDADGHPRYRGARGMRPLVEDLASPLDVRTRHRVAAVGPAAGGWRIETDGGVTLHADAVVCTPPVPQTLALLEAGSTRLPEPAERALAAIAYDPCIAVLATPSREPSLPNAGALRLGGEPLEWIADNRAKGISRTPAVTVHAGPRTSEERWNDPDESIGRWLCDAASEIVDAELTPIRVHRWRYSRPTTAALEEAHLLVDAPAPLAFAGDAFAGGRVEGAARSGRAAALALIRRLDAGG